MQSRCLAKARDAKQWFNKKLTTRISLAGGPVSVRTAKLSLLATFASILALGVFGSMPAAVDATPPALLGTAQSFSVLGGTTVTNTGSTTLGGDLGVYPGSAVTGAASITFAGGGSVHTADGVAHTAQTDTTTAYNTLLGSGACTTEPTNLNGLTLGPGIYCVPAAASNLTGTLTLNAGNVTDASFTFRSPSTLITSSGSTVIVTNPGASECNIFWQVTSSATLDTGSTFVGNIVALTSITLKTGAHLTGRALARNGAVTMDTNTITAPSCMTAAAPTATSVPATATPTATSVPATATSAPSSGGGGGGAQATAVPSAPTAAASVPTLTPSTPLPRATVAAVQIHAPTPQATVAAVHIYPSTHQIPLAAPHTGGGYGQLQSAPSQTGSGYPLQRELLLAILGLSGLLAMIVWLRKRHTS